MNHEFIHPNWHVVLLHYPLGLLTIGLLIEILALFWRRSTVRTAGRWMLLIGALSCIPTMTVGLYAFRDVVSTGPISLDLKWHEVLYGSTWTDAQWQFMQRHVLFAAIGAGLFIVCTITWLAASNRGRQALHWPLLIVMIVAFGVLNTAAWYSGESVYTQATAVTDAQRSTAPPPLLPLTTSTAPADSGLPAVISTPPPGGYGPKTIQYYIQPLQLHVLLAGLTIAIALGAIGVSIRRWSADAQVVSRSGPVVMAHTQAGPYDPAEPRGPVQVATVATVTAPPLFAARVWLWALLAGLGTLLAGLWFTGDWELRALREPLENRFALDQTPRLFGHVLFGSSILLIVLLLALLTRVSRRQRLLTSLLIVLLLIAVAGQVWLGILMLFDSAQGPVTGFNPA